MTFGRLIVAIAILAASAAAISGCGSSAGAASSDRAAADPPANAHPARHYRFFSPRSPWNRVLPAKTPVDPASAAIVTGLDEEVEREVAAKNGPWINTTSYSVPVVRAARDTPTVTIHLTAPYAAVALRRAFAAVPLPPGAAPSPGKDAHLVLYQPSSDRLWEFWHLRRVGSGWAASWGGAFDHASEASGVYGPHAWPGATAFWGASASSLSIAGGLITLADLNHGWIDHALSMSLPQVRAHVYASPARRTDGNSEDPLTLPEGAHLRLPADLDLAALHLPHLTMMMAEAAQHYGIYIRDRAHNIAFDAQAPRSSAKDHYVGPGGYFGGLTPRELLVEFPWSELQLLPMRLHRSGGHGAAAIAGPN